MKPWKALYAGALAGLLAAQAAAPDGFSQQDWFNLGLAVLAAVGGVYGIDNTWGTSKPPPDHAAP